LALVFRQRHGSHQRQVVGAQPLLARQQVDHEVAERRVGFRELRDGRPGLGQIDVVALQVDHERTLHLRPLGLQGVAEDGFDAAGLLPFRLLVVRAAGVRTRPPPPAVPVGLGVRQTAQRAIDQRPQRGVLHGAEFLDQAFHRVRFVDPLDGAEHGGRTRRV
jgi:hypothetical protein